MRFQLTANSNSHHHRFFLQVEEAYEYSSSGFNDTCGITWGGVSIPLKFYFEHGGGWTVVCVFLPSDAFNIICGHDNKTAENPKVHFYACWLVKSSA